jgi:hypothetical protein
MMAKFDKIMKPIGDILVSPEQLKYLSADAFFWNVTFHEVAHGLGVKQTVNGKGTVDAAMGSEKTTWEEAKADILGLFMVSKLIDMGEITDITKEESVATFIAGIVRSVRFGFASSHGKANMMCYNYMEEHGAFTRNAEGKYVIDFEKAAEVIDSWANLILTTQANGSMQPVHDRMPVMISRDEIQPWLNDDERLADFLERPQVQLVCEQESGQIRMDFGL